MAVFEYPRTRMDEWYRYLELTNYYPYYTVGNPPVGIEEYKPPTRAEDRECWAKKVAATEEKPALDGAPEVADRVENIVADIATGRATPMHRQVIRKALDAKEAPPTGRAAADAGLGRAIRWGGV